MKKLALLLSAAVFAASAVIPCRSESPEVASAGTYILTEESTGRVLAEHKADERVQIASMTKIMLLLLVAEEINADRLSMSDNVTATARASGAGGSVIWLEPGEVMSAGDLVKSVVMASANDAAMALAEHIGGSEEAFVKQMNLKAYTLGMADTHFSNAAGFDDENNYSTARDVAVMSKALMREENYRIFSDFALTRLSSVRTGTPRETQLLNTNKLIGRYKGIEGLKTGTTDKAGFCVSAVAKRGSMRLIAVVTGCENEESRVKSAETLLNLGFTGYELYAPDSGTELPNIRVVGGIEREIRVVAEKSAGIVIPKGRGKDVKYEIYTPEKVSAPVMKNQPVGNIAAWLDGEVVYEGYIVAADGARKLTFGRSLGLLVERFFSM